MSLLVAGCLAGSAVAAANTTDVKRGASSKYEWEIGHCDHEVVIFKVEGTIFPATVLVHVNNNDGHHDDDGHHNDDLRGEDSHSAVTLENCGDHRSLRVRQGETVQCKVWPGHPLTADSCGGEVVEGTVQVINI